MFKINLKQLQHFFSNLFLRQVMIQILKDMGITEYEPRVINQMLEFTYSTFPAVLSSQRWSASTVLDSPSASPLLTSGYVTTIIEDAKIYATHAKKSTVDADDIKLAIQCRMDQSFTSPPPRDVRHRHHLTFMHLVICVRAYNVELHVLCFSFCWRWPDRRTRPRCH